MGEGWSGKHWASVHVGAPAESHKSIRAAQDKFEGHRVVKVAGDAHPSVLFGCSSLHFTAPLRIEGVNVVQVLFLGCLRLQEEPSQRVQ